MDFFNTLTYKEVLELIEKKYSDIYIESEDVNILDSLGRVLSEDIISPEDLPHFNRSTVDGYSVISNDTFGASEAIPSIHKIVEKIEMGKKTKMSLSSGEAAYIPTGAMVPKNSDAVVMIEHSELLSEDEVALYKGVAHLENIIKAGDDISKGAKIIQKGKKIRPQEIAVLASIGIDKVKVRKKIKCTIISTGDELIDINEKIEEGKIRDINTYAIEAMLKDCGCEVISKVVLKDTKSLFEKALKEAISKSDLVLISGGSSVGDRDHTYDVIKSMGEVFVHGISIKPGKPTILGISEKTAIVGLPGHPGAAMSVFEVVVKAIINKLEKCSVKKRAGVYKISTNVHSAPGKHTIQLVKIEKERAIPILGKSSMISCLSEADGYIEIPMDSEGLYKEQEVNVNFF